MAASIFDLNGSVAVVTGGNGGIGLAMAEALGAAGAAVCIWGRNPTKNDAALERLAATGADAVALQVDVSDEGQIVDAFAATLDRFGRVDSCFANAGVGSGFSAFEDMSLEEWRRVLDVNLDGVFVTFREAVRHMLDRGGGGSLVVTSSIASEMGVPRGENYAASKAAVSALVRSIAVERGKHGIRANAVLPGWVETDMTDGILDMDRFVASQLPRIPLRRWGTPEDFGGIAVYLASDASRWHTGSTIIIDGGYRVS
jgi:NAD(P)-dependent dehydrogenase (short-subunit alcohol dehydrogenase family)